MSHINNLKKRLTVDFVKTDMLPEDGTALAPWLAATPNRSEVPAASLALSSQQYSGLFVPKKLALTPRAGHWLLECQHQHHWS